MVEVAARSAAVLSAALGLHVRGSVALHEAELGDAADDAEGEEGDGVHVTWPPALSCCSWGRHAGVWVFRRAYGRS